MVFGTCERFGSFNIKEIGAWELLMQGMKKSLLNQF
jgi:hypothetical protein